MMRDNPIRLGRKRHCLAHVLGMAAILLRGLGALRAASGQKRSVMILEPFGLGDILSLEPMIRVLKDDGWEVNVCAKAQWKPVIPPGNVDAWLNEKIPWTSYEDGEKYRLAAFRTPEWRGFMRELRALSCGGIGIDCRGDIRNVILLRLAGCRTVWTPSHYAGSDLRMTPGSARIAPSGGARKKWELNLAFARALGSGSVTSSPPPNATHLLPKNQRTDANRIGLVPVAPWQGRLWPSGKWKELAAKLSQRGKKLVVFHGPGQASLAQEMLGKGVPIVEASSALDWAVQLSSVGLVVSLDSGPLHLADALSVPVVGLYGAGKLPLWAPSGPQSRIVHHQDRPGFYPCHQVNANIELGRRYMDWIQVDEVLAAIG
jgi:ADP-heptose:LPS heptosyltransferase